MTKEEREALVRVMNTKDGRTVINWIVVLSGFYASNGASEFLCGRRSVGGNVIEFVERIDGEPDGLALEYTMRREAAERAKLAKPDTYQYEAGL